MAAESLSPPTIVNMPIYILCVVEVVVWVELLWAILRASEYGGRRPIQSKKFYTANNLILHQLPYDISI